MKPRYVIASRLPDGSTNYWQGPLSAPGRNSFWGVKATAMVWQSPPSDIASDIRETYRVNAHVEKIT